MGILNSGDSREVKITYFQDNKKKVKLKFTENYRILNYFITIYEYIYIFEEKLKINLIENNSTSIKNTSLKFYNKNVFILFKRVFH